jgi:putative membrane protein
VFRRLTLTAAALCVVLTGHAHAHERSLGELSHVWTWNPWVWLTAAISSWLYFGGQARVRQRPAPEQRTRDRLEQGAFVLAWVSILLALISPLDRFSDVLFSAHMLQHELLMLIAAPLFALARPLHRYLWALPDTVRRNAIVTLQRPSVRKTLHAISAPAMAVALHAVVRWLWHLPWLFEAALASEWVHGVQHASFFFTALLFWWTLVHGRYGRLGYGVSVVFVFATALHTGALGVLISIARQPLYPRYQQQADAFHQNALNDQQLAGLVMWIGAGFVLTLLGLGLFAAWLGEAERRSRRNALIANSQ